MARGDQKDRIKAGLLKRFEAANAAVEGGWLSKIGLYLSGGAVGAPRGPLHAGCSTGGVADIFNTDVRSTLILVLWCILKVHPTATTTRRSAILKS